MDYSFLPQPVQHTLQKPWLLPSFSVVLLLGSLLTLWNTVNTVWLMPSNVAPTIFRAPIVINAQQLAQAHLFGASANMSDLPLASLGITLKGIFFDSQNQATAVVAQNSGDTTNYHKGEQLAPNIFIVDILPTSVIIKHNGKLEKLVMPIQPIEFSNQSSSNGLWNT
jgi:type II secretory pathway component PulC